MTTENKSQEPPMPLDEPASVNLDGQLLDALSDYREKKMAMRSPSFTLEEKAHKQSEYIAACERLAHSLDHRVRTKVDLESLGYSKQQLAQIKENSAEMATEFHGVAYTLPKRT